MMIELVSIIAFILLITFISLLRANFEPFISPLAGPVDLLQQPKQLLMDGYRFQDSLFPPEESNLRQVTDLCPHHRQRVGVFKDKAYIIEGFESPGAGSLIQVSARGVQDQHLLGHKGDRIEENINLLLSSYASYGPPEVDREVNYPNQVFSWGDVFHRFNDRSISLLNK